MKRLELQIDDDTARRLGESAKSRGITPELLATEVLTRADFSSSPLLGLFHEAPEVVDGIVRDAYDFRRMA